MSALVQPGDTIVRLAVRHLDDALRWRELATLNRLDAPYVVDDPDAFRLDGLNVLGPGDALVLPLASGVAAASIPEAEERTYGIDLGWDDDLINLLDEGTKPGLDRGIANLKKALVRRVTTRPGELPAHPEYGCRIHELLGTAGSLEHAQLAAQFVKVALEADSRVQSATVTVTFDPDTARLNWDADVTPVPPAEVFAVGGSVVSR